MTRKQKNRQTSPLADTKLIFYFQKGLREDVFGGMEGRNNFEDLGGYEML